MEYRHIFVDETTNKRLSSNEIVTGETGDKEVKTGMQGVSDKVKEELMKKAVNLPLNQMTGGLYKEARSVVKAFKEDGEKRAAFIGGSIAGLVIKGLEIAWDMHEKRIAELENQAKEANDAENLLIKAGRMNINNYVTTYNRYGRAVYKTDRS